MLHGMMCSFVRYLPLLCLGPVLGCGSSDGDEAAGNGGAGGSSSQSANGGEAPVGDPSAPLFDALSPPEFHLTLSEQAYDNLQDDPSVYQRGEFRYVSGDTGDELIVEDVGIRLKGRASFEDLNGKAAFKIKFSEFVDGQRFLGLRRLTLNNMAQDPSTVRERLGYIFLSEAGVTAPRSNHARVYLNDEYYGLYANVETLDESFLDRHFDPPDGNLYDTSNEEYFVDFVPEDLEWFELETNQDANDRSDLEMLANVVDGPMDDVMATLGEVIALPQVLRLGAVQAVMADWDGYFGASNNYKLYHDVATDRFVLFPWGIDQTFNYMDGSYDILDYAIDASESNRPNGIVMQRCRNDEACYAEYLDQVREVLVVFESINLMATLDEILPRIEQSWLDDERTPHSQSDYDRALEAVREFLEQRGDLVRAQLEQQ
jgi:spore coat protein CotH